MPGVKAVFKKYASAGGKGSSDAPAAVTILDFFDFLDVLATPRQHATHRTQRNPTYNIQHARRPADARLLRLPRCTCNTQHPACNTQHRATTWQASAPVRAGHIRAAI
jgi:hypothetical protein